MEDNTDNNNIDNVNTPTITMQDLLDAIQALTRKMEGQNDTQEKSKVITDEVRKLSSKIDNSDNTGAKYFKDETSGDEIDYHAFDDNIIETIETSTMLRVESIYTISDEAENAYKLVLGNNSFNNSQYSKLAFRIRTDQLGKSSNPTEIKVDDILEVVTAQPVKVDHLYELMVEEDTNVTAQEHLAVINYDDSATIDHKDNDSEDSPDAISSSNLQLVMKMVKIINASTMRKIMAMMISKQMLGSLLI